MSFGTTIVVFLLGVLTGAILFWKLSRKDSKRVKEEKEKAEKEYQDKLAAIEKDRTAKIAELEAKKAELEEERKKIQDMTAEQAKNKLSSETQTSIDQSSSSATNEAVSNILNRVKG